MEHRLEEHDQGIQSRSKRCNNNIWEIKRWSKAMKGLNSDVRYEGVWADSSQWGRLTSAREWRG